MADFYVRELVSRGIVTVSHVPTGEMLADALTKALAAPKFGALVACFMAKLTCTQGLCGGIGGGGCQGSCGGDLGPAPRDFWFGVQTAEGGERL